jgi:uncharacterized membrane protein YfcA
VIEALPVLGLGLASVLVGILVGTTGIGGFLIIPALSFLTGVPIRAAMGTALLASAANGALGAYLFRRRGNVDWSVAWPLAAGAVIFAFVGAWLNRWLPVRLVVGALGCVMLAGSILSLRKASAPRPQLARAKPWARFAVLLLIGCLSGMVAGLTGAGGPLVSVPLMAILAYPVLATVGAGQILQLVAGASGLIPYWQAGNVSLDMALIIVPLQLLGIRLGVQLAHAVDSRIATRAVAIVGMAAGLGILAFAGA